MAHRILLYIHIASAILTIGPFFAVLPIIKKLRDAQESVLEAYISTFKFVVRFTMHAGHVLVVSGILLVVFSSWTWTTSWILVPVLVMVSSLYFFARAFSPLLRKFTEEKQDREVLSKKLMSATIWYILILLVVLGFMVIKPNLW